MKTHDNGNQLPVEGTDSDQFPGESPSAHECYKLYRDMPLGKRSLRALCHLEVTGEKRSERVIKRWSSDYNWQERVKAYDAKVERAAYQKKMSQRQTEIEAFIDEDMAISIKIQKLCQMRLKECEEAPEKIDFKELRQLALTYKESREWLKEAIGIMREEYNEEETEGQEEG